MSLPANFSQSIMNTKFQTRTIMVIDIMLSFWIAMQLKTLLTGIYREHRWWECALEKGSKSLVILYKIQTTIIGWWMYSLSSSNFFICHQWNRDLKCSSVGLSAFQKLTTFATIHPPMILQYPLHSLVAFPEKWATNV